MHREQKAFRIDRTDPRGPASRFRFEEVSLLLGFVTSAPEAAAGASSLPQEAAAHPYTDFAFSRDHASAAISACGSTIRETPALDAPSAEGPLLGSPSCTTALCLPSRAVVLSGLHRPFHDVDRTRKNHVVSMRIASYILAIERVAAIYKLRGVLA